MKLNKTKIREVQNIKFNNFFILKYPETINPLIKYTKCNDIKDSNFKLFKQFEKNLGEINKKREYDERLSETQGEILGLIRNKHNIIEYIFLPFIKKSVHLYFDKLNIQINKDKPLIKIGEEYVSVKDKHFAIKTNTYSANIYTVIKNMDYCERQKNTYLYRLKVLYYLYNILELGGIYYTAISNYCDISEIEYIYLLSLLFEKIIFLKHNHIYCINFLGEKRLNKNDLKKIIKKGKFCIEPKFEVNDLMNYLNNNIKKIIYEQKLLLKGEYKKFKLEIFKGALSLYLELGLNHEYVSDVIDNYKAKLLFENDTKNVNNYINDIVINVLKKNKKDDLLLIKKILKEKSNFSHYLSILEVGMGYGFYTKEILDLLDKDKNNLKRLIVIDSNQKKRWDNIGLKNIENCNKKYFTLLNCNEEKQCFELLSKKYEKMTFDLIILHEYSSYESLMYQLYNILPNLGVNSYLMFEKTILFQVQKVIEYIENNLLFLEKIPNKYGIPLFKKINDDKRILSRNFYEF